MTGPTACSPTAPSRPGDGGLLVADVWESREKFDSFVEGRLGAAIGQAVGPDAPQPDITETPLHTFYARQDLVGAPRASQR